MVPRCWWDATVFVAATLWVLLIHPPDGDRAADATEMGSCRFLEPDRRYATEGGPDMFAVSGRGSGCGFDRAGVPSVDGRRRCEERRNCRRGGNVDDAGLRVGPTLQRPPRASRRRIRPGTTYRVSRGHLMGTHETDSATAAGEDDSVAVKGLLGGYFSHERFCIF